MTLIRVAFSVATSAVLLYLLAYAEPDRRVELPVAPLADARVVRLGPEDDLQFALDQAVSGDVIELPAGSVFYGPFVLKPHAGPGWITITSRSDAGAALPPAGTRVTPDDASAMATLVAATGPVISTAPSAARYHFVGIEIRPGHRGSLLDYVAGTRRTLTNLVELSVGNNDSDIMPSHIVFERCYLHGDPVLGTRRGIAMNGAHMAVIDSHLADFKSVEDSQAIASWEGAGPFLINNNYLEAAGENVMFGGADPDVRDRIPSDITVTGNHFSKPLSWRLADPSHDGSNWTVKNLLELKNARRVLIDGNLFEHNWPGGQNGFAILFTVRNQDGASPWSQIEDVTFSNNIVRQVAAGINILGYDDIHESERTQGVRIHNNLFHDVGGDWGSGWLLQILNSPAGIAFLHNTALHTGAVLFMEGDPIPDVDISWNIVTENSSGISGSGTAPGLHSIETYLADPVSIKENILIGDGDVPYPPGMTRFKGTASMLFENAEFRDFHLLEPAQISIENSTEVPGVDFTALCSALSMTERPSYC